MESYHFIPCRGDLLEEHQPVNYLERRRNTELIIHKVERLLKLKCFYCYNCENFTKFQIYQKEFKRNGFWTFNKYIEFWDIFDPYYNSKNANFEIRPIRVCNFQRFKSKTDKMYMITLSCFLRFIICIINNGNILVKKKNQRLILLVMFYSKYIRKFAYSLVVFL